MEGVKKSVEILEKKQEDESRLRRAVRTIAEKNGYLCVGGRTHRGAALSAASHRPQAAGALKNQLKFAAPS